MNKQREIVNEMRVLEEIDATVEIENRVNFIKDYLLDNEKVKTLVLGISGGIDSAVCGKLAQLAVNKANKIIGETKYEFIAVRLPYGVQKDENECVEALDFINPDRIVYLNIKESVDAIVTTLELSLGEQISDFDKGNIKARVRMLQQYALAGKYNGIVLGTDHSAESVVGFYTKYGDGAADIVPLFGLNKRQVRLLGKELGCVEKLYNKVATADLEDEKPQLADEVALGVTYNDVDDYLEGKEISEKSSTIIECWYDRTKHKRSLPVSLYDQLD